MLGGSISALGRTYLLTLQATNCRMGETLAREEAEAEDKDHVVRALARLVTGIRVKLGDRGL